MKPTTLLVRPGWIQGESWPGYLLRLANANAMTTSTLRQRLRISFKQLVISTPQGVLGALGIDRQCTPQAVACKADDSLSPHFIPYITRHWSGRLARTAVCPHCLAEDEVPFIRARWDSPLELGCRVHRRSLLTSCRACGGDIRANRPQLLVCTCGASLLGQHVEALETSWTQVFDAFGMPPASADATFRPVDLAELLAVRVVRQLGCYERGQAEHGAQSLRISDRMTAEEFQAAAEWFANWPRGFEERYALARMEPRPERSEGGGYVRACSVFSDCFPNIQAAVQRVRARQESELGRPDVTPKVTHRPIMHTAEKTGELLGLPVETVRDMAKHDHFDGVDQFPSRGRVFPDRSIQEVRSALADMETLKFAAEAVGMSREALSGLVRIGLIPGFVYIQHRWVEHNVGAYWAGWVCRRTRMLLSDALEAVARPADSSTTRFASLSSWIAWHVQQREWQKAVLLIDGILRGEVPLCYRGKGRWPDPYLVDLHH